MNDLALRFRDAIATRLGALTPEFVAALRKLEHHCFPPQVAQCAFQVFPDDLTGPLPLHLYLLDRLGNEVHLDLGGGPVDPGPVGPQLSTTPLHLGEALEHEIEADENDLDTFTLFGEQVVTWFAGLWRTTIGPGFPHKAWIMIHDDRRHFDLTTQQWSDL